LEEDVDMEVSDLVSWLHETECLADVLRRLRAAQELTLQEVAHYAGIAKSYISMIERGQKTPELDTLIALLLAAFSLPVPLANRVLLFAGYAPLHHRALARQAA
jgi:transcriptional regulator with XRE-family HTH domain